MKLLALMMAIGACGGSSSSVDALGTGGPCSVTLTGAATGSFPCVVPRTTWLSSSNAANFTFALTTGSPAVQVAIGFAGQPMVGQHYTTSDGSSTGGVVVTDESNSMMWDASAASGSNAAKGMFDLSFTVVTTSIVSATGTSYSVNGGLTAMLPAVSGTGATGMVKLTAVF
jgi:hypothetical protein